mmetsp:Transcript_29725/g.22057  ORF Transcript_29725/g.22057 Transcript_29725/m.22057 type:complete len:153 (+) Transcript_29725:644-1102(+)
MNVHKVIVIDEVDTFQAQEKMFLTLMKALLKQPTNTSIVGIANSVDLPFKKKTSAIALRDAQLLFEPYTTDEIVSILEEKLNKKYQCFPPHLHQVKQVFFELVDDKAKEVIARKVAKTNGDIRIAFDILKSALLTLANEIKQSPDDLPSNKL